MSDIYLKHAVDTDANITGDADFTAGKIAISSDGHKLVYKAGTTAYRAAVEGGSPSFSTMSATMVICSGDVTAVNFDASGDVDAVNGDFTGNITAVDADVSGVIKVDSVQVVGPRVVDARADDAIDDTTWNSTSAGVLDALRDAMIAHGLISAS